MRIDTQPARSRASVGVLLALFGVQAGLFACASTPPKAAPADTRAVADAGIQCTTERPTGSMLATKVCTTKAQRDAFAAAARNANDAVQRSHYAACPSAPGCAK